MHLLCVIQLPTEREQRSCSNLRRSCQPAFLWSRWYAYIVIFISLSVIFTLKIYKPCLWKLRSEEHTTTCFKIKYKNRKRKLSVPTSSSEVPLDSKRNWNRLPDQKVNTLHGGCGGRWRLLLWDRARSATWGVRPAIGHPFRLRRWGRATELARHNHMAPNYLIRRPPRRPFDLLFRSRVDIGRKRGGTRETANFNGNSKNARPVIR